MKPHWIQTIAWIAAVVAAVLLAFANPVGLGFFTDGHAYRPHGGITPRWASRAPPRARRR